MVVACAAVTGHNGHRQWVVQTGSFVCLVEARIHGSLGEVSLSSKQSDWMLII